MTEIYQFDDFKPANHTSPKLNYADTCRALAVVAGQRGDVDERDAFLKMAEMFQEK